MIDVRPAEPSDLHAVVDVGRTAYFATFEPLVGDAYARAGLQRFWTPDVLEVEIANGWVLVACDARQVVGMASARPEGDELFLARLYVHPSHHGRGIGHALMGAVLDAAAGPVALTVLSTNQHAATFYERHGFRQVGVEPDADGGPDQLRYQRA